MRRAAVGLSVLALVAGVITTGAPGALAAPAAPPRSEPRASSTPDELPNALEDKRRALKSEAVQQVVRGEATPVTRNGSTVVKLKSALAGKRKDKYVELAREKTDRIFVVLAEFGDQRDPAYPDQDTDPATPGPVRYDGPARNEIPEPDRAVDNSTVWQPDYSADHYRQLYFGTGKDTESLKTYYETQSSGRYSVDGEVTDWVRVPYNEARYGRSNGYPCAGIVCSNTWDLLKDALTAWVADQKAAGRTQAQITADVKSFDQWDRYDYDGDGVFNEPDGYLDHFQVVHAGGDQADGDPTFGEDAIWSHRWYAYQNGIGSTGPANNKLGGVEIPGTGVYAADYTVQPENGGLSVFAHEYGHDLGLPDDYDTAGGASNNNEYWTLMSQSRLNAKGEALGTRPGDIGAWQKLQLGWLNYRTVTAGQRRTLDLGPAEYNSAKPQAAVVVLPDKKLTRQLPKPTSGSKQWWSGQGDDYTATLTKTGVPLPAGAATLSADAAWNIEDCGPDPCDYAYAEVRPAGGAWTAIPGSITQAAEGNGIDGVSDGYQPATFDLSAYAGSTVDLRFRYSSDGAAQGTDASAPAGLFLDDIAVTAGATTVLKDDAESTAAGWTASGFSRVGSSTSDSFANYYIAANRSYVGYDRYLQTGPYNFGDPTKPDLVEHFPYQQGVLVSYWDTSQTDNDVSQHPGLGLSLVVDSHPKPLKDSTGAALRNRIQLYDAPFGVFRTDPLSLLVNGKRTTVPSQSGTPLFDDTKDYDDETAPGAGVKLRKAGVKILVLNQRGTSNRIVVF